MTGGKQGFFHNQATTALLWISDSATLLWQTNRTISSKGAEDSIRPMHSCSVLWCVPVALLQLPDCVNANCGWDSEGQCGNDHRVIGDGQFRSAG
ncbi:hypothetical protein AAFF_G00283450 [Aldrovandia affinis]|uniref:Uncharacterized protein n=1 Tax=Aldrovandia affinis TaxID=143900 RepID=A0AAD7X1W1_9TELE|nr:hypothetical protein AAFF_G00283450 [Aldrovandia affinis]